MKTCEYFGPTPSGSMRTRKLSSEKIAKYDNQKKHSYIQLDSPRWRVGDPCFLLLRHDRPWNAWPQGGLNRVLGMRSCAVGQKWGLCPHRQKGLERRGEPRALSRLRNRLAARRPESRIRGGLGHGFTTLWPWARLSSSSPTRLTINDGIFMQVWLFKSIRYRYIIKGFSFPLLPGAGI